MNFSDMSLFQLSEGLQKKEFSSHEVVSYFLNRISTYNDQLNSFITVNEKALEEAQKQDNQRTNSPWAGVPISLKDNFCTEGLKTTAASKLLSNFSPLYDSTVARRLKNQGMIILGKNNMDEFGMGSTTENSYYGSCRNPWNLDYTPGGSSGGSAAAVSSGMSPASLGTDTGGSVRLPSHFCGLVGLKPTYGRISRFGIVSYASSLDQAGSMTKRVQDSAHLLEILAGFDENDATSSQEKVPSFASEINSDVKNMKIGVINFSDSVHIDESVKETFDLSVKALKEQGAQIVPIELDYMNYFVSVYYIIAPSEASSNLSRYEGVRYGLRSDFSQKPAESLDEFYTRTRTEGFGEEVKKRIIIGTYALSSGYYEACYLKACRIRRLIQKNYLDNFKKCDVILSPVASTTSFPLGQYKKDPIHSYSNDIFTLGVNLSGLPALSCPVNLSKDKKLPCGVQFIAPPFEEQRLFNVGSFLENYFEFYKQKCEGFS